MDVILSWETTDLLIAYLRDVDVAKKHGYVSVAGTLVEMLVKARVETRGRLSWPVEDAKPGS